MVFSFKEYTDRMIGVGLIDHWGMRSLNEQRYSSDFLSVAIHKMLKSKNYFSFGFQPGLLHYARQNKFD